MPTSMYFQFSNGETKSFEVAQKEGEVMSPEAPNSSAVVRSYVPLLCVGFLLSLSLPFHSRFFAFHSYQRVVNVAKSLDESPSDTQAEVGDRVIRQLMAHWVPEMSYDEQGSTSEGGEYSEPQEFVNEIGSSNVGEVGTTAMRDESVMPASAFIRGSGRGGRGGREKKRHGGRSGKGAGMHEASSSSSSSSSSSATFATIALEPQQEEINTGRSFSVRTADIDLSSDASLDSILAIYHGVVSVPPSSSSSSSSSAAAAAVSPSSSQLSKMPPKEPVATPTAAPFNIRSNTAAGNTVTPETMAAAAARAPPRVAVVRENSSHLVPDYLALAKRNGIIPDFSKQSGVFEKDDPKLHLCNAQFEAYSAAWLTTREHVIEVKSETFNLTWVNCEMASFIHMRDSNNFYKNPHGKGMIIQSLDVLDFAVIHLSTYERSNKKYMRKLWTDKNERKEQWSKIEPVIQSAISLEKANRNKKFQYLPEAYRTVVVMPFLGGAMGAGHSELGNRFVYLKACFWSLYEHFPYITMGVTSENDVAWGYNQSGLPFYDIILLPKLPKSAGLPVGTTQQVKQKLVSGEWDFDYVFYTESDQILLLRILPYLYQSLRKYPSRMLLPHRLMAYSSRIMKEIHNKAGMLSANHQKDWTTSLSCCIERQNCRDRKTWVKIYDPKVHVLNYLGLHVPLGNVNFLDEKYRSCLLGPYMDVCP